jgi:hypothetical protein
VHQLVNKKTLIISRCMVCMWKPPTVSSCLYRASIVSKHFLFFQLDAHRYKITEILKQSKFWQLLRHVSVHAGTIIRELFRALLKLQLKLQLRFRCSSLVTWSMSWRYTSLFASAQYTVEEGTPSFLHRVLYTCKQAGMPPWHWPRH